MTIFASLKIVMSLLLIDKENYVLDGVLYTLPLSEAPPLDEVSVEKAVAYYKKKLVDADLAYGKLEEAIQESVENDMSIEEYEQYATQDPIAIAANQTIDGTFDDEEILHPNESAFQLLDILYDRESRTIIGRIYLLDTPAGRYAKSRVDAGMHCVVTQAYVDEVVDNKARGHGFVLNKKVRKIRGGWRIAFENQETLNEQGQ